MGVVQIWLEDLDLSNLVIGWYKLFSTSSMCDPPLPSEPLGASPQKSQMSPRSQMGHMMASPVRMSSPRPPTIVRPPGHMDGMDEDGDYVWRECCACSWAQTKQREFWVSKAGRVCRRVSDWFGSFSAMRRTTWQIAELRLRALQESYLRTEVCTSQTEECEGFYLSYRR